MKVIIAGSRTVKDMRLIKSAVAESGFTITELVTGCANGADALGIKYASQKEIPITPFPPDWQNDGRAAGIVRNVRMGNYAEALIAIWDGTSRGTNHMIEYALKKGLKVYVKKVGTVRKR